MTITATVLCIISAIPLLCGVFFTQLLNGSQLDQLMTGLVAGTLILIAIGVFFFVKSNIIMDSYNILLQTDDYTPKKKTWSQDYEQIRHTLFVNSSLTLSRI